MLLFGDTVYATKRKEAQKMIANYHTHTFRCRHAIGTEREYIETAIARGLTTLGFADHAPQLFPDNYYSTYRMYPEEIENYVSTLLSLRDEYRNDIEILIGLETEYFPELFEKLLEHLKPYPIDYMILGQHYIDNEYDTHVYAGMLRGEADYLKRYVNNVCDGIRTGKFSYIAHPDLFRFVGDDGIYESEYRRLCECAKSLDIPLEINFLGLSENRHYPSDKFMRIAAEVGNSFIFGCDAHEPDAVKNPRDYQIALDFAEKYGITPIERLNLKKI